MRTGLEQHLIRVAARYGITVTPPPDRWQYERGTAFLVRCHPSGWNVAVARMLVNWRIIECDGYGNPNGRYWCYRLGDLHVWVNVVQQANTYSEEPTGWIKSHNGSPQSRPPSP